MTDVTNPITTSEGAVARLRAEIKATWAVYASYKSVPPKSVIERLETLAAVLDELEAVKRERDRLREALMFYALGCATFASIPAAERGDVDMATASEAFNEDAGEVARKALSTLPDKETDDNE